MEMQRLAQKSGKAKPARERLDWMYRELLAVFDAHPGIDKVMIKQNEFTRQDTKAKRADAAFGARRRPRCCYSPRNGGAGRHMCGCHSATLACFTVESLQPPTSTVRCLRM